MWSSCKTPPKPKPSSEQNSPEFESHHKQFLHTTTIYLLNPPTTAATTAPFITAAVNTTNKLQLRHPLTLNHHTHHHPLPPTFNLKALNPTTLATCHHTVSFDKVIVYNVADEQALIGLSDGGRLRGLPPHCNNWVSLSRDGNDAQLFDDVVVYKDKVYVVDRSGMISTVNFCMSSKMKVGKALVDSPVPKWARRFEWRKRLVVDEKYLYVVVRTEERKFRVFKVGSHGEVGYFVYKKLLFMCRDYCFFYEGDGLLRCGNYMVYSDEAFPRYGEGDCWVLGKQEFRVFELKGFSVGKHDINEDFRKLDWSPPAWVLDAWLSVAGDSETRSLSDREREEGVGFNSNCRNVKDEEMQSDLDANSKDETDEKMQSDREREEGVGFNSNCRNEKDEEIQSDLKDANSKDEMDEKMQSDPKDSICKGDKDKEMQSDFKNSNSKCDKDEEMQSDLKDSKSKGDKDDEKQSDLEDLNSKGDKDEEMQSDPKNSNSKGDKDEEMQSDLKDTNSKGDKDDEKQSDLEDLNSKGDKDEEMQSDPKNSNNKGDKDEEMESDLKDPNSKDEKDEGKQSEIDDSTNKDEKHEEMLLELKDSNSEVEKDEEMQSEMNDSNNKDEKDEEMQSDLKGSNGKGEKDEEKQSEMKDSNNEEEKDEEMQSDLKDTNSKDEKDVEMLSEMKDSNNKDGKDEEMQSDLKDSNGKDEKYEETQSDLLSQDKEPEGMDLDSNSQDQDDGKMDCDLNSQENEDERVTRSLCSMDAGNDATGQGTSMNTTTQSMPGASTSCTPKSDRSNFGTDKFEGFDIRADLVPTLRIIWQKHGNIIENSSIRSGDIIAKALESLAIMVRILEDNTSQSLSACQADYLTSTLSDLRCISFKVHWLIPFIETAVNIHKSKGLLESLDNLSQLSSQVKERRTVLFDELAKLGEMENKLEEEMTKVPKVIPFSGTVKLDEPLGLGIT